MADRAHAALMNASSTDLRTFFAHGGKLLQFHGWSDTQISPLNTIQYYESVPEKSDNSYRLFMIPASAIVEGVMASRVLTRSKFSIDGLCRAKLLTASTECGS